MRAVRHFLAITTATLRPVSCALKNPSSSTRPPWKSRCRTSQSARANVTPAPLRTPEPRAGGQGRVAVLEWPPRRPCPLRGFTTPWKKFLSLLYAARRAFDDSISAVRPAGAVSSPERLPLRPTLLQSTEVAAVCLPRLSLSPVHHWRDFSLSRRHGGDPPARPSAEARGGARYLPSRRRVCPAQRRWDLPAWYPSGVTLACGRPAGRGSCLESGRVR
jgi:hypothetical protein